MSIVLMWKAKKSAEYRLFKNSPVERARPINSATFGEKNKRPTPCERIA